MVAHRVAAAAEARVDRPALRLRGQTWFSGSVSGSPSAVVLAGCLCVPRSETLTQSLSDELPVSVPYKVSATWRPPVTRCLEFSGSMISGE